MNDLIQWVRSHPARFYLAIFILLILPAIGLFPLAQADNSFGMALFMLVIVLANIAALLF